MSLETSQYYQTIPDFPIINTFQGIINFSQSIDWVNVCSYLSFGFYQRLARSNWVRYGTWEAGRVLITATTATNVSKALSAPTALATATVTTACEHSKRYKGSYGKSNHEELAIDWKIKNNFNRSGGFKNLNLFRFFLISAPKFRLVVSSAKQLFFFSVWLLLLLLLLLLLVVLLLLLLLHFHFHTQSLQTFGHWKEQHRSKTVLLFCIV